MALLISQILIFKLLGSKVSFDIPQFVLVLICELIDFTVLGGCFSNHIEACTSCGTRREETGSKEGQQTVLYCACSSI